MVPAISGNWIRYVRSRCTKMAEDPGSADRNHRNTQINKRARVEAAMNRGKQVIGDELRAHSDKRRATKVAVAVHALNRMVELGRTSYVRVA
jgi:hypothetical protein